MAPIRLHNPMDGVPDVVRPPIAPGDRFVYEFAPPDAGTFFSSATEAQPPSTCGLPRWPCCASPDAPKRRRLRPRCSRPFAAGSRLAAHCVEYSTLPRAVAQSAGRAPTPRHRDRLCQRAPPSHAYIRRSSRCVPRGRRRRLAGREARHVVKAFVLAEGYAPSDELARDSVLGAPPPLRLRLPPPDRVRRRRPQDAGGQDPPYRAASGGAGGNAQAAS